LFKSNSPSSSPFAPVYGPPLQTQQPQTNSHYPKSQNTENQNVQYPRNQQYEQPGQNQLQSSGGYSRFQGEPQTTYTRNDVADSREQQRQQVQPSTSIVGHGPDSRSPTTALQGDVEYQKAVLSSYFTQTEQPSTSQKDQNPSSSIGRPQNPGPIPTPTSFFSGYNSNPIQNGNSNGFQSVSVQAGYQVGPNIQAQPQQQRSGFIPLAGQQDQPLDFSRYSAPAEPRPIYGIPLAPVIGLDSHENLSDDAVVVDSNPGSNNDLGYSFPSTGGYGGGSNRNLFRRRVGIVTRLR
jgi:hypothetical protein